MGFFYRLAVCICFLTVVAAAEPPKRALVMVFDQMRAEYIEKYGMSAVEFAKAGFATLAVDWRGQGLAGRGEDRFHARALCQLPGYRYLPYLRRYSKRK